MDQPLIDFFGHTGVCAIFELGRCRNEKNQSFWALEGEKLCLIL